MNRNINPNQGDKTWMWVAIGVVVAGAAALVYVRNRPESTPPPAITAAPLPPPPATESAPEHHPIEESQVAPPPSQALPLPATDQTDEVFKHLLGELVGASLFDSLFENKDILHRIVATIDNLPRESVPAKVWVVKPAAGHFLVSGKDDTLAIAPENTLRYAPYLQLVKATDPHRLVEAYVRHYPLFQQAYVELGFPQAYFNDRVIYAIDNLLATPAVNPPQHLAQPHVLYQYADPSLEALSFGQKTLLRMGADDANEIKNKLREIRALLVKQAPAKH